MAGWTSISAVSPAAGCGWWAIVASPSAVGAPSGAWGVVVAAAALRLVATHSNLIIMFIYTNIIIYCQKFIMILFEVVKNPDVQLLDRRAPKQ